MCDRYIMNFDFRKTSRQARLKLMYMMPINRQECRQNIVLLTMRFNSHTTVFIATIRCYFGQMNLRMLCFWKFIESWIILWQLALTALRYAIFGCVIKDYIRLLYFQFKRRLIFLIFSRYAKHRSLLVFLLDAWLTW